MNREIALWMCKGKRYDNTKPHNPIVIMLPILLVVMFIIPHDGEGIQTENKNRTVQEKYSHQRSSVDGSISLALS